MPNPKWPKPNRPPPPRTPTPPSLPSESDTSSPGSHIFARQAINKSDLPDDVLIFDVKTGEPLNAGPKNTAPVEQQNAPGPSQAVPAAAQASSSVEQQTPGPSQAGPADDKPIYSGWEKIEEAAPGDWAQPVGPQPRVAHAPMDYNTGSSVSGWTRDYPGAKNARSNRRSKNKKGRGRDRPPPVKWIPRREQTLAPGAYEVVPVPAQPANFGPPNVYGGSAKDITPWAPSRINAADADPVKVDPSVPKPDDANVPKLSPWAKITSWEEGYEVDDDSNTPRDDDNAEPWVPEPTWRDDAPSPPAAPTPAQAPARVRAVRFHDAERTARAPAPYELFPQKVELTTLPNDETDLLLGCCDGSPTPPIKLSVYRAKLAECMGPKPPKNDGPTNTEYLRAVFDPAWKPGEKPKPVVHPDGAAPTEFPFTFLDGFKPTDIEGPENVTKEILEKHEADIQKREANIKKNEEILKKQQAIKMQQEAIKMQQEAIKKYGESSKTQPRWIKAQQQNTGLPMHGTGHTAVTDFGANQNMKGKNERDVNIGRPHFGRHANNNFGNRFAGPHFGSRVPDYNAAKRAPDGSLPRFDPNAYGNKPSTAPNSRFVRHNRSGSSSSRLTNAQVWSEPAKEVADYNAHKRGPDGSLPRFDPHKWAGKSWESPGHRVADDNSSYHGSDGSPTPFGKRAFERNHRAATNAAGERVGIPSTIPLTPNILRLCPATPTDSSTKSSPANRGSATASPNQGGIPVVVVPRASETADVQTSKGTETPDQADKNKGGDISKDADISDN